MRSNFANLAIVLITCLAPVGAGCQFSPMHPAPVGADAAQVEEDKTVDQRETPLAPAQPGAASCDVIYRTCHVPTVTTDLVPELYIPTLGNTLYQNDYSHSASPNEVMFADGSRHVAVSSGLVWNDSTHTLQVGNGDTGHVNVNGNMSFGFPDDVLSMNGATINMGTGAITSLIDPTAGQDAMTLAYANAHYASSGSSLAIGSSVTSGTANSVLFLGAGTPGVLAQDNTNFSYSPTAGSQELIVGGATIGTFSIGGPFPVASVYGSNTQGFGNELFMTPGPGSTTIFLDLTDVGTTLSAGAHNLLLEGSSLTMNNQLSMGTHKIVNVTNPTAAQDAMTKNYADTHYTAIGAVTSVSGTAPIVSSGGATPAISLANTAVTAGSYTSTNLTVDAQGRITAAANGSAGGVSIGGAVTSGTPGSILFVGTGPVLAQDNASFFWDDADGRLGIGTTAPASRVYIRGGGVSFFTAEDTGGTGTKLVIDAFGSAPKSSDVSEVNGNSLSLQRSGAGNVNVYNMLTMQNNTIDMNSHKVVNVTDPTGAQDAATKAYVDSTARVSFSPIWTSGTIVAVISPGHFFYPFESGSTTISSGENAIAAQVAHAYTTIKVTYVGSAQTGTGSEIFTLRKAGVDTTIACTIAVGSTSCSGTGSSAFLASDAWSVSQVSSGSPVGNIVPVITTY